MFGSDFFGNFGIPQQLPFQGIDPQGGLLAPNAPPPGTPPAGQAPAMGAQQQPAPPAQSPLSAGPLGPGGGAQTLPAPESGPTAPAAGLASPFGKPNL